MQNINVTRYANPKATGWAGYIEPADLSWIAFIGLDGRPVFFLNRDPATGAILSDDPGARERDIANAGETAARGGAHTGMKIAAEKAPEWSIGPIAAVGPLGVSGNGGRDVG
jgi:hypothetical protein